MSEVQWQFFVFFFKYDDEILLVHKLYLDNVAGSQNLPFTPGHIIVHNKICGFKVALSASDYPVDFPEIRKFPKAFLTCVIT